MSFNKFKADFFDQFPGLATNKEISSFINSYVIEQVKNEADEAETPPTEAGAVRMPFGKYKSFLISDLYKMDAGKQYLIWLYSQSFFDAEKFPVLHKCLTDLGVSKKKVMNNAMRVARVPVGAR